MPIFNKVWLAQVTDESFKLCFEALQPNNPQGLYRPHFNESLFPNRTCTIGNFELEELAKIRDTINDYLKLKRYE